MTGGDGRLQATEEACFSFLMDGLNRFLHHCSLLRTYTYLLRPDLEQAKQLDCLFWQSRTLYYAALEQRIQTYSATGQGMGYGAQWAHFRDVRHEHRDSYGQLNPSSRQHMLRRMD